MTNLGQKPEAHKHIVWIVLGCGAVGGVASWVYSVTLDLPIPPSKFIAAFAYPFLGTIAAYITVFNLAHSDLRVPRRVAAFAILCGFAWKPVLDGALASMEAKSAQATTEKGERVAALADELGAAPPQEKESIAKALGVEAARYFEMAGEKWYFSPPPSTEANAKLAIDALAHYGQSSSARDEAAIVANQAIGSIGRSAADSELDRIVDWASIGVLEVTRKANRPSVIRTAFDQLYGIRSPLINADWTPGAYSNIEALAEVATFAKSGALGPDRLKIVYEQVGAAKAQSKKRGDPVRTNRLSGLERKIMTKLPERDR